MVSGRCGTVGDVGLVYVTGSAGSGKSAVARELGRRGVEAFDEDDPAVGSAHNIRTGLPVAVPPADERSPQWFSEHEWRLRDGALQQMRLRATDALVVLCGNVFRPPAAAELFDRVLYLHVDEATLRQRISTRDENDYGRTASELQRILERHRQLLADARGHGVVFIDATQPLAQVASAVLHASGPF